MPYKAKFLSDEEEGNERILPEITPDDDDIPFDDEKVVNRSLPQEMTDYDVAPFEDKEGLESSPPNCKMPLSDT